jgi:hypothetical protein
MADEEERFNLTNNLNTTMITLAMKWDRRYAQLLQQVYDQLQKLDTTYGQGSGLLAVLQHLECDVASYADSTDALASRL